MSTNVELNIDPNSELITLNAIEDNTLVTIIVNGGETTNNTSTVSFKQTIIAGEYLNENCLVYVDIDGKCYKAYNNNETKVSKTLLWCISTLNTDEVGEAISKGPIQIFTGFSLIGVEYYVGLNGNLITSIPEIEGIFERYVGTVIEPDYLFFDPDNNYYELTLEDSSSNPSTSTGIPEPTINGIYGRKKLNSTITWEEVVEKSVYDIEIAQKETLGVAQGLIDNHLLQSDPHSQYQLLTDMVNYYTIAQSNTRYPVTIKTGGTYFQQNKILQQNSVDIIKIPQMNKVYLFEDGGTTSVAMNLAWTITNNLHTEDIFLFENRRTTGDVTITADGSQVWFYIDGVDQVITLKPTQTALLYRWATNSYLGYSIFLNKGTVPFSSITGDPASNTALMALFDSSMTLTEVSTAITSNTLVITTTNDKDIINISTTGAITINTITAPTAYFKKEIIFPIAVTGVTINVSLYHSLKGTFTNGVVNKLTIQKLDNSGKYFLTW